MLKLEVFYFQHIKIIIYDNNTYKLCFKLGRYFLIVFMCYEYT